jgi:hydroxypyruvate reductase
VPPDSAALRAAARAILDAAIAAGDARRLTRAALAREGRWLRVAGRAFDLERVRRVIVVGAGKAGGAMALAVEETLAGRAVEGLVAVNDAAGIAPARIRLAVAAHPVPDARGEAAAAAVLALCEGAGRDDLVLCLISGGGSALLPAPVGGVTLEAKQAVTQLLLEAGANIQELNTVRKHLSRLKGGQLARAAHPAPTVALLLSDVIGDPLDVIASGPTAPDPTTFQDALAVLARFDPGDRVPRMVRAHLEAGAAGRVPETPGPGDPVLAEVTNVVIGNNELIVRAAADQAARLGYPPHVLTNRLQGEAREAARAFGAVLLDVARIGRPVATPACLLAAGETTVTVRGSGRGGRCQEFCLALAETLGGAPGIVALAAGTDGSDGPTDAAGAVVDPGTLDQASARGLDPRAHLVDNDAHTFFSALGDLVRTGPTGTNLMDLYVGLVADRSRSDRP